MIDLSGALVVAISQSGRIEEIAQTQAWAWRFGAATIAVTNVKGSPLTQAVTWRRSPGRSCWPVAAMAT